MVTVDKQTKPWQWQEGEYTVTRSTAWSGPGCHEGCGVRLYTDNTGKLVKVEGDPENPFNQGRLCPRCLALPNVTNHPDRLQYPMKRVGQRGENKWQRISWDEAYGTIVKRFSEIGEQNGPESIIFCQGTGRDIGAYISRLAFSSGSPNWTGLLSGEACYMPRVATMVLTAGAFGVADCSQYFADRYNNINWRPPSTIAIWGNNPLTANSDGFYGHWVVECMKRGSKLVVIDPKLTWLASRAQHWLQIRPGTDAALALGMINIIIKENLYDKEFVDKWCYGFGELTKRAAEFPVERVSDITWIPEEKIVAAARMIAQEKPSTLQWGLAIDMTKEGVAAGHALTALWAITGNLDIPGGFIFTMPPYGVWQPWGGAWGFEELLSPEQKAKRIGPDRYPMLATGLFQLASPDMVMDAMETGLPYPIKAAWLQTTNPLPCMGSDVQRTYRALKNLDFVVVVDLFMTPSAVAHADIVLPAATYPERDGLRAVWYQLSAINKVTQIGECKSDMQINLELGKRLNPKAWPWENVQEMFTGMIQEVGTPLTFEQLRENGPMVPPYEYKKYEKGLLRQDGKPGFGTPTGKVELYSTIFEQWGYDPLPYFEEPTESPFSTPDLYKEYPLVLTTGARPWGFFHSEHRQIPVLRELHPEPELQIHPDTAARYGIKDGDWVWIENRMGRCKQKAKLTKILDLRVVSADHAWWFPEKPAAEPELFGVWDVAINQLVPFLCGRVGFGSNVKSLLCKIYKVKEGEM